MTKNILKTVLKAIPFLGLWYFLLLGISVAKSEGYLSVLGDVHGAWSLKLGFVIMLVIIASIFYLRFFIKKEWLIQFIDFGLTFLFVFGGIFLSNECDKRFLEFTTEKWISYPQRRLTMYFDLTEKYNIKGYSKEQVKSLLGEPDKKYDNVESRAARTYIYDDRHGNMVSIGFNDGKALFIEYSE